MAELYRALSGAVFAFVRQRLSGIDDHAVQAVVVDIHAEATSEKMAMGHFVDGRASLVVGTHTHVATADERVLPQGTAYITDVTPEPDRAGGQEQGTALLVDITGPGAAPSVSPLAT